MKQRPETYTRWGQGDEMAERLGVVIVSLRPYKISSVSTISVMMSCLVTDLGRFATPVDHQGLPGVGSSQPIHF